MMVPISYCMDRSKYDLFIYDSKANPRIRLKQVYGIVYLCYKMMLALTHNTGSWIGYRRY